MRKKSWLGNVAQFVINSAKLYKVPNRLNLLETHSLIVPGESTDEQQHPPPAVKEEAAATPVTTATPVAGEPGCLFGEEHELGN